MKANGAAAEAKPQTEATSEHWQQLCAELTAERDQLRLELAKAVKQRDQCRKALIVLMRQDADFDKKAILAQVGKGQSFKDLIAQLESQGAS